MHVPPTSRWGGRGPEATRRGPRPTVHGRVSRPIYGAVKVNETSAVAPVATVTFCVWVPRRSCHASMT